MSGGVSGHLYPGTPATSGAGPTVHLIVPDRLEDACDRLTGAGGEVIGPVIEMPWGRFVYATDPDGNSIGLFQPKLAA
jgi:predicted enzyme related to lactoylglutathione lyase